jgi:hypothetical protein
MLRAIASGATFSELLAAALRDHEVAAFGWERSRHASRSRSGSLRLIVNWMSFLREREVLRYRQVE